VKRLNGEFFAGISVICLRQQKEQLSEALTGSDNKNLIENRKSLHQSKAVEVDTVLMECIRHQRSEIFHFDYATIWMQMNFFYK
jgi:hypothetical protein